MLQSMASIPGIGLRIGREIGRRFRRHGARSAWICARVHLQNGSLRLRSRLLSTDRVECPCCGWRGPGFRALDCGRFLVPEVECPHCGAHERHRFLHLFLTRRPPVFMMDQTETEEYGAPDPELFDHVRGYSPLDFKVRLAPFDYEEIVPSAMLPPGDVDRYKIPDSQVIYLCRKGGEHHG